MAGGLTGTSDVARIEAPVTAKAYMMCAFASFGGIFFGYDSGYISGVMGMPYFIHLYVSYRHHSLHPLMTHQLTSLFRPAKQFLAQMHPRLRKTLSFFPLAINL